MRGTDMGGRIWDNERTEGGQERMEERADRRRDERMAGRKMEGRKSDVDGKPQENGRRDHWNAGVKTEKESRREERTRHLCREDGCGVKRKDDVEDRSIRRLGLKGRNGTGKGTTIQEAGPSVVLAAGDSYTDT